MLLADSQYISCSYSRLVVSLSATSSNGRKQLGQSLQGLGLTYKVFILLTINSFLLFVQVLKSNSKLTHTLVSKACMPFLLLTHSCGNKRHLSNLKNTLKRLWDENFSFLSDDLSRVIQFALVTYVKVMSLLRNVPIICSLFLLGSLAS